jgi:hypothetical protein
LLLLLLLLLLLFSNHMSIQYGNKSVSHLSGGKWCLQATKCADNIISDCRKLHKHESSNSCHRSGVCDDWKVPFCKALFQGWVFIFYWYLRLGKENFNGWISNFFTKKNISLPPFSPPPV